MDLTGKCTNFTDITMLFMLKIGPWGPELIWQLATKYKMSRHQRHLQYVIIYTMTNEVGVSIFGMYMSQKVQNVIFLKIHNFKEYYLQMHNFCPVGSPSIDT